MGINLGKILGGLGSVASFIPGVGGLVGAGLGALGGAISGGQKQGQANKINQQMLQQALARYQQTAPLRARSVQVGMNLQPQRPDLGAMFQSGNPFARSIPRGQLPTGVPMAPPAAGYPPPGGVPMTPPAGGRSPMAVAFARLKAQRGMGPGGVGPVGGIGGTMRPEDERRIV